MELLWRMRGRNILFYRLTGDLALSHAVWSCVFSVFSCVGCVQLSVVHSCCPGHSVVAAGLCHPVLKPSYGSLLLCCTWRLVWALEVIPGLSHFNVTERDATELTNVCQMDMVSISNTLSLSWICLLLFNAWCLSAVMYLFWYLLSSRRLTIKPWPREPQDNMTWNVITPTF